METNTPLSPDNSLDTGTVLSQKESAPVQKDDEISLIDLLAVLLKYKKMIITLTAAGMIAVFIFAVVSIKMPPEKSPLPNKYTPQAHMLINDSSSSSSTAASLLASSGLSSLAGLAGVSTGASYSSLAVYLAGTDSFLDTVVDKFDLINRYKIKKFVRAESRKALKKNLTADFDSDSGVFTISFTDRDPTFACEVVNYCVDYMDNRFTELGVDNNKIEKVNLEKNIASCLEELDRLEKESHRIETEVYGGSSNSIPSIALETNRISLEIGAQKTIYSQLKTQYELLKVKMQSETPVFQVLEKATVPDQKSKPSRGKLCIIVTFAMFFISIFLAFLRNAIENIKKDPDAMAKLSNGAHAKKTLAFLLFATLFAFTPVSKPLQLFAQSGVNEENGGAAGTATQAIAELEASSQIAMSVPNYKVTAGDIYSLNYAAGSIPVSFSILVDNTYKIPVSNLATLNCAGMTFVQLKTQVEAIVRKNYPLSGVQFALVTPAQYLIKITGEVNYTQEKRAWSLTRLSSIIASAKTDYSSTRDVQVTSDSGKTVSYDLFKATREGDLSNDPYIRPGDIITLKRISRNVSISGQVERPGTYQLLPGENLAALIHRYGNNLTERADTTRMELTRTILDSGKKENSNYAVNKIYLKSEAIDADYNLLNYDSVYIPSILDVQPVLFIEGAINLGTDGAATPDSSNRISINFKEGENLASLVRSYRTIFNATSDTANAYIIHEGTKKNENLNRILFDANYYSDIVLHNGDTLMVPFRQYFVTVSGAVVTPGRYPYIPDRDWNYYIGLAGGIIPERNRNNSIVIKDLSGMKLTKQDPITPEANIYVETNSFLYYFNQYSGPITTVLSLIATALSAVATTISLTR